MTDTTWRREIEKEMAMHGDTWTTSSGEIDDVVDLSLCDDAEFAAWGRDRVYFPLVYDSTMWVGSAPRDPCGGSVKAQGGG